MSSVEKQTNTTRAENNKPAKKIGSKEDKKEKDDKKDRLTAQMLKLEGKIKMYEDKLSTLRARKVILDNKINRMSQ